MSAKPMTRQAWLDYLKKAVDDFDWEAAGQEREWVGLTDEEIEEVERWVEFKEEGSGRIPMIKLVKCVETKLKEKNT